jgi:integrase
MVDLQDLTGMRPGEVVAMRGCDIDRTGSVWIYRPARHKTDYRERERFVPIGPRAQAVLGPWLREDPGGYLFSPAEAEVGRNAERRKGRKTAMTPSQARRQRKRRPRRAPGACYAKNSYAQAVRRACERAGVPHWHPNQLRHAAATRIRKKYDLEAAQVVLGHAKADVTQVYAERDQNRAMEIAAEIG